MRNIGHVSQYHTLEAIYRAVTQNAASVCIDEHSGSSVTIVPVRHFHAKRLNYLDDQGIRYVQQNPHTSSAYAKRAQAGAQIIWIIRLSDNTYLGRIEDGQVYMK